MRTIDTDVVIVGAGPAGIFCALSLLERGFTGRIVMVDKGLAVEDRVCPKQAGAPCANCEPCRITTGFSGAGAFSDGKLSLSADVGGDLPDLIGRDEAQDAIGAVDGVYPVSYTHLLGYYKARRATRDDFERAKALLEGGHRAMASLGIREGLKKYPSARRLMRSIDAGKTLALIHI